MRPKIVHFLYMKILFILSKPIFIQIETFLYDRDCDHVSRIIWIRIRSMILSKILLVSFERKSALVVPFGGFM